MAEPLEFAYLDGGFLPLKEARISPLDRGFLFGDGVYEVVPVYAGRPFGEAAHLARLRRSLREIRIDDPMDTDSWSALIGELVARNGGGDQAVYLQVTRGADAGRDHRFPEAVPATVFGMSSPLATISQDVLDSGLSCITVDDLRWRRCDVKSVSLLANVLHRQAASDAGAGESLLVREGKLLEASASSVFLASAGSVVTPPLDYSILPGITRDVLISLLREAGVEVEERDVTRDELVKADEVWLCSSTKEVLPVTRIDGAPVADGEPGPLWRQAWDLFQSHKRTLAEAAG